MPTNPQVAAGGSPLIPQQTPTQASAALNPTPVNYTVPTSGLWRGSGDTQGDAIFKTNPDGTITQYQVGGAAGIKNLSSQYGLDFWSLPSYNQGDTFQAAVKAGKLTPNSQGTAYEKGFNIGNLSDLAQPNTPAGSTTAAMNTTPNQLGDIAGATAAQTQQLAGDQGMNVTQTTTPEGVAAVQKTPLGTPPAQTPQQGALGQPPTTPGAGGAAPSPLDLLKQELLGAQHQLTQMGAPVNDLAKQYNAAFDALKGSQSPNSSGDAASQIADITKGATTTTPGQDFLAGYGSLNAAEKQLYDTIQTQLSATTTQQTLAQQFAAAMANPNIPAGTPGVSLSQEQMNLMNIDNIMKGSEADIRSEITKAGGFATESQVQALTTARNKTLLTQAAAIQQSETLKQDYINNLMNFTEKDQAQVTADLNQKLGLEQAQVTLLQNVQNAATQNLQNIIKTNGYQGLYAAFQGNPTALAAAEKTLGLPSGGIAQEAAQEAQQAQLSAQKPLQFVSGTTNQAAGYFDPNTGVFTALHGAGGPISTTDTSGTDTVDPSSQSILAQTGLSVAAFNFLTQGTSALSRLSATDRQKIMTEAGNFLNKRGLDYSTFQSQYKAQNNVVEQNIQRAANTKVFGNEVSGTVSQFINDIGSNITNLKPATVAQLFATGQTNDATAQKYAFDLKTMQNDLAGYYAASRGSNSPDQSDLNSAAQVITQGLSAQGAAAFKQSLDANVQKVNGVVSEATTAAQKAIWDQFGVGDKYQPTSSQYAPGSIIVNNGQQYQVGQDGQTITPVGGAVDFTNKANVTANNSIFGSGQSFF